MTNIRDAMEEKCVGAVSRRTCEDGVFERFWLQTAAEAGGTGPRGPLGGLCRQVAFPSSYLVDSPCHELAQARKGAWMKGWGVVIVGTGGIAGTSPR